MTSLTGILGGYIADRLSSLNLAYLHLVNPLLASIQDGTAPEPRRLEMLEAMRERYRGTLMIAGGFDPEMARDWLEQGRADIIAFGHTHKPYVKQVDGVWFVNAGSVGKPKDGDPRACYVLLDPAATNPAAFVRVAYDVAAAAAAIRASGLPHEFAADVEAGGTP